MSRVIKKLDNAIMTAFHLLHEMIDENFQLAVIVAVFMVAFLLVFWGSL